MLDTIRVLYREPDTLALWGIPYEMRRDVGQAPRHLLARHRAGTLCMFGDPPWIWLGSPGWYGHLARSEQRLIRAWLAAVDVLLGEGTVPGNPHEWSEIPEGLRPLANYVQNLLT